MMKVQKAVLTLTFAAFALSFAGCATQPQDRHLSSEERTYASDEASRLDKKPVACKEYEVRNETDGSCERAIRTDRPFRRSGF